MPTNPFMKSVLLALKGSADDKGKSNVKKNIIASFYSDIAPNNIISNLQR